MKIIAGLGNPGPRYETTRHNAGFLAIDRLVEEWKGGSPNFQHEGEIYQASHAGEKILLVKPLTYMNNSGRTLAPLFNFYKCEPEDLIVIHDEVDIPPLQLRLKTGGGSGGHNGLRSIDASLGAGMLNYHRIRIGVGKPGQVPYEQSKLSTADHVLQQFTDDELQGLDPVLEKVVQACSLIVRGDMKSAMNKFNTRT